MAWTLSGPCRAQTPPIAYRLQFSDAHAHTLHLLVMLPPGPAERQIQLPVWNALYQVRDFTKNVRGLRAHDLAGNALPVEVLDKTTWQLRNTEKGAEVEYDVFADSPGPYGAQFNSLHAFLNLGEVLVYAVGARNLPVTLELEGLPHGWDIATALDQEGKNKFSAPSYDALIDAPVEAGSFGHSSFTQDGAEYELVVDAEPADYDMKRLSALVSRITAAEVAWMQDRPFKKYIFIFHFPHGVAGGGMEHASSCAIEVDASELAADPLDLESVTAHEFFHLWNVKRIRPASLEPVDYTRENYTRALWFSEGFTDTVADITLRRAGLLSEPEFLRALAREIRTLELRPAHTWQSAEESSLDVWLEKYPEYGSPQRSISYYNKGDLLGVLLDLEMRRASNGKKSLRDLFQWMNRQYAMQHQFFPDSAGVEEAAEAVTGSSFAQFFHSYVSSVQELPYSELLATVGLQVAQHKVELPDIGFDSVRNEGERPLVVAVREGSEAARLGVAVGDTVLKINGKPVQEAVEKMLSGSHPGELVHLEVMSAAGMREIKIKLAVREEEQVTIADLPEVTANQRARRKAWLAGEDEP